MAYPGPIIKLTYGGSCATEDEWSNSLTLSSNNASDNPTAFAGLEPQNYEAAIRAAYITGSTGIAQYNTLEWIKLSLIGIDGKLIGDAKIYDLATPAVGPGPSSMAPQNSIVVTLDTIARRGLASKGRFFLPAGYADVATTTARLSPASVTALVTRMQTYLNAVNAVTSTSGERTYVSVASGIGAGVIRVATGLRVGNLVDTQRRRRNRLTETYTDAPLTIS